ncbi:MAG: Crp/Fnr family transcriptional regulator [Tissierellia bacterium]|nr:Crp/Fnr family transcriptional regulator [Tissierellia bacterium]
MEKVCMSYYSPWIEGKVSCLEYVETFFYKCKKIYNKEQIIFQQGENLNSLYVVKNGRVRLFMSSEDGDVFHTIIAKPGCFFGEVGFIDGYPEDSGAIAIVRTEIYVIPYKDAYELLLEDKRFGLLLINSMVRKTRVYNKIIENLIFKDSFKKVAMQLINLANAHGVKTEDKNIIKVCIKVTHEDISNITNLNRVTVSNIMSYLAKQNLIFKKDGFLHINNNKFYTYLHY